MPSARPAFAVCSQAHKVSLAEPWTLAWPVTNSFQPQPLKFRLEALMSAAPVTDTNTLLLPALTKAGGEPWNFTSASGVTCSVVSAVSPGDAGCMLVATNAGRVVRNSAWVRWEERFQPLLNLKDRQGLALEVEGDGSGAVLAIRLESPRAIAYGAIADRYVNLDFTGSRVFTLVESESSRWSDYVWDDGKSLYNAYRETIDFSAVESVSVWLQHLPPGRKTEVRLGPVRALPLRAGRVRNPHIRLGGQIIEFPVELASGSWLEGNGPGDCAAYGSKGEPLGKVKPVGDWPTLPAGAVQVRFSCDSAAGPAPRARFTVFSQGPEL